MLLAPDALSILHYLGTPGCQLVMLLQQGFACWSAVHPLWPVPYLLCPPHGAMQARRRGCPDTGSLVQAGEHPCKASILMTDYDSHAHHLHAAACNLGESWTTQLELQQPTPIPGRDMMA
jgi:hypothetical protein